MVVRVGDLEIAQDIGFQRRTWVVQRCGWAVMALVVVVATLGYFGHGPRSDSDVVSADGSYRVQYPRYARHRAPDSFRVAIGAGAVNGDEARLTLARRYLEGVEVESVFPEPDSVEVGHGEAAYVFKLRRPGAPATIVFNVRHEDIGRRRAQVRLDGHPSVSYSQFVYP